MAGNEDITSPVSSSSSNASTITSHQPSTPGTGSGVTTTVTTPSPSDDISVTVTTTLPDSLQRGITVTTTTTRSDPPTPALPKTYRLKTYHGRPADKVFSLHGKVKTMHFYRSFKIEGYCKVDDTVEPSATSLWTSVVVEFSVPEDRMYWALHEARKLPGFVKSYLPPSWESSPYYKPGGDPPGSSRSTETP